jgi:hypothetical protein
MAVVTTTAVSAASAVTAAATAIRVATAIAAATVRRSRRGHGRQRRAITALKATTSNLRLFQHRAINLLHLRSLTNMINMYCYVCYKHESSIAAIVNS